MSNIFEESVDFVENLFNKTLSVEDEQQFINDFFKTETPIGKTDVESPLNSPTISSASAAPVMFDIQPKSPEPQYAGSIEITIKTQIQTNRRTNIYLDADWPEDILNTKIPIHYYPPIEESLHQQIRDIEDPSQLWLSEMTNSSKAQDSYLEVQYWIKTQEGKMQLINKCLTHPTIIKMNGQPYEEKAISHEEVKWSRNTMIYGINFNCTRTCFKSELYMFLRVRIANKYYESGVVELPFRRSEKRKHDSNGELKASKRQIIKQTAKLVIQPHHSVHPSSPTSSSSSSPISSAPILSRNSSSTSLELPPLILTSTSSNSSLNSSPATFSSPPLLTQIESSIPIETPIIPNNFDFVNNFNFRTTSNFVPSFGMDLSDVLDLEVDRPWDENPD